MSVLKEGMAGERKIWFPWVKFSGSSISNPRGKPLDGVCPTLAKTLASIGIQNLTPAYKLTLGQDLHLQAVGGHVRMGGVAVVECPMACRQR